MAWMRKYQREQKTTPRSRYDARCAEIEKHAAIVEEAKQEIIRLKVKSGDLHGDLLLQARREAAGDPDEFDRIMSGITDVRAAITRDIEKQERIAKEHFQVIRTLTAKNYRVLSNVGGDARRLMQ